ncbi:MAG TPA: GNAT family N-acetyltransferase [Chitinophagaceae bacterium]
MRFQSLSSVSLAELTQTFNEAFSDYFVPLRLSEEAMAVKLRSESIDLRYSIGAFEESQLKGFILHGIDTWSGQKAVYNAGTGVVPAYRGQGLTRQLYGAIVPLLKAEGMVQHQLEVIEQNAPAIRVYEKVGFTRTRSLSCFKGRVEGVVNPELSLVEVTIPDFQAYKGYWSFTPTWQNDTPAIQLAQDVHKIVELRKDGERIAYAIIAPASGRVKQYAVHPQYRRKGYGLQLFQYLCQANEGRDVILINVDDSDTASQDFFKSIGFQRFLGLWEMRYRCKEG